MIKFFVSDAITVIFLKVPTSLPLIKKYNVWSTEFIKKKHPFELENLNIN